MLRLLVSFSLVVASSLSAQATLLRLPAIADASADADQPTVNFGSDPLVTCGKTFTNSPSFRVWLTRGHFQFDLTPLGGRPLPVRARLRVYQAVANAAGCLDASAHRITAPWNEATVTWQNKPTHDAAILGRACVGDSFDAGWKAFDVTAAVHGWLLNSYPNHGLVIRDVSESLAGAARPLHGASREATNQDQHPHLEINYETAPFGTGCGPTTAPTLDLDSGSPARGDTYTVVAGGFRSGTPLVHLVGTSDTTWNGLPLPFNLGSLGYPACNVLVAGDFTLGATANSRGRTTLSLTIQNRPGLIGFRIYHQVFGIDANQNFLLTNGYVAQVF